LSAPCLVQLAEEGRREVTRALALALIVIAAAALADTTTCRQSGSEWTCTTRRDDGRTPQS